MDGFFDKYGQVIIIAVAICFVLLYLTPMRNVVGSSINGFAGNFANKVGESLGTVKMPDGMRNDGSCETPDGIEVGKSIKIDGKAYTVLKQTGDNKFLVVTDAKRNRFQQISYNNDIDDDYNTYENSNIDKYLENTYYPSLSEQLRNAIELTEIKQVSYESYSDDDSYMRPILNKKYDTNYKGQKYNTLKRHVYLPSAEDTSVLDKETAGGYNTRDSYHSNSGCFWSFVSSYRGLVGSGDLMPGNSIWSRPAFIVDLSKVDYELVE